jgi:hypothetical protein
MVLKGGVEEQAAIQWEMSMWLRKRGDERHFGDHVNRKRIFSDYVERRGGDSLTMKFGEEVTEKQTITGPGEEEVMKEVLGTMRSGKE